MNKVVNINLNGFIFSIDEQAYDLLKQYIDRLRQHFSGTEGAAEIISDIETRIAELLQQRLNEQNHVVQLADVQAVIAMMGEPWQMGDEEKKEEKQQQQRQQTSYQSEGPRRLRRDTSNRVLGGVCSGVANYMGVDPAIFRAIFAIAFLVFGTGLLLYVILWIALPAAKPVELDHPQAVKRLFRDPDNRMIAGVCSGVGQYFGLDAVWFRIAFLVSFFFFGSGLLLYIVLWVALPKAKTAAEKLQMKGQPVDINNIERVVKDSFARSGEQVHKGINYAGNQVRRTGSVLGDVLKDVFAVFARVLGFVLLAVGVGLLVLLLLCILGVCDYRFHLFMETLVVNGTTLMLAKLGWFMLFGSIAAVMILSGIKLLFRVAFKTRLINVIMLIIFLGGCGIFSTAAAKYVYGVHEKKSITEKLGRFPCPDTLYFRASDRWSKDHKTNKISFEWNDEDYYTIKEVDGEGLLFSINALRLLPSTDDSLAVSIYKSAHGMSDAEALEHARNLDYQWSIHDSLITLDPGVLLPEGQPYKFQYVTMKMRIPVGTIVQLDDQTYGMLKRAHYNRHHDEFDGRMYKMTTKGLQCLDCEDYDHDDQYDHDWDWNDRDHHGRWKDDDDDDHGDHGDEEISIDLGGDKDDGGVHIKVNDHKKGSETETIEIKKDGKTIRKKVKKVGPVTITESETEEK